METGVIEQHGIGKECKNYMVKELSKRFLDDRNVFITSFCGLGAEDLNQLRQALKKASSQYLVVKNSIAKMALKEAKLEEVTKFIEEGVGIAFGGKDPIGTIKALTAFAKSHEGLVVRTGYLDGEVLTKEKIKEISRLPSREALLTKLVWLVNSPVTGFVNVLAGILRSFVYVLQARKEKLSEAQTSGASVASEQKSDG